MFLVTLLVIALTGFVLEGVRIAMDSPGYGATQFVGWVIAQPLSGVGDATLAAVRHGLWWFHGLLAITFVASIPYTKAAHMLASCRELCSLRRPAACGALACPRSHPTGLTSRPGTESRETSAPCTCSSSTRARSVAAATTSAPQTRRGCRCRRGT